jgi:hypothetical protein
MIKWYKVSYQDKTYTDQEWDIEAYTHNEAAETRAADECDENAECCDDYIYKGGRHFIVEEADTGITKVIHVTGEAQMHFYGDEVE